MTVFAEIIRTVSLGTYEKDRTDSGRVLSSLWASQAQCLGLT
jgi:hypothetical protein